MNLAMQVMFQCTRVVNSSDCDLQDQFHESLGASLAECGDVLELISRCLIVPMLEEMPFGDVVEGLKRVERSEISGRLFARPHN